MATHVFGGCCFLFLLISSGSAYAAPAPAQAAPPLNPRAVIEAKFAAVNRHDVEAIAGFYARDAALQASDFCAERQGQSEVKRTYTAIFAFAPQIRAQVQELIVEGDSVAARVLLRSDAPNLRFELPIMNFFTVSDGKITRDLGVFDNGGRACKP